MASSALLFWGCVEDSADRDATVAAADIRPDVVAQDSKAVDLIPAPDLTITADLTFTGDTGGCALDEMYMQCYGIICPKKKCLCSSTDPVCKKMCKWNACCECEEGKWAVVYVYCGACDGGTPDS